MDGFECGLSLDANQYTHLSPCELTAGFLRRASRLSSTFVNMRCGCGVYRRENSVYVG